MKKTIALIALLCCTGLFAQVTKLSSLTNSKFLGSATIFEDNNEDVYGYFILYEKNRESKIVLDLEYVLLDKNMNKVSQAVFKHGAQNLGPFKITCYLENIKKIKDNLYITLAYRSNYGALNTFGKIQDFRKLNLKDFTMSDTHKLNAKGELMVEPLRDKKMNEFYDVTLLEFTNLGSGFIAGGNLKDLHNMKSNQIGYYDLDLKQKWVYKFNQNKTDKRPAQINFLKENGNDIVFYKQYLKKAGELEVIDLSLQIVDAKTGKDKFEIPLKDTEYIYDYDKSFFHNGKFIVVASLFKYKDKREFEAKDKLGYMRLTYDLVTGKQEGKDLLKWQDLSQKFDINEKGNIKDYGRIHFLDFRILSNGNMMVAAEGHTMGHSAKTLDSYMLVFDEKMKMTDFAKIEKSPREIDLVPESSDQIERAGEFDYMYSQKLNEDEFVFYYKNKVKVKGEKPSWVLGIITYTNGKFDSGTVPLKTTEGNKLIPLPAKKGYVLFKEVSEKAKGKDDDEAEETFRLEKVNY